jgi:glycosyltransferase involved in cell wall biosynthesis
LPPKRIIIADAHVPFVTGGAELHVRRLCEVLRRHGHDVDVVQLPFRSQPKDELLAQAAAWRLLDLSSSNGQPVDLLIATRFPTYFARHPRKVAWVIHQHRAAYELCGTPYSDFEHTEADVGLRRKLFDLDARMLGECRHVFANSNNTARRLQTFNGVAADGLYHPPPLADRLHHGPYGDYVLVVGRLENVKRVELAIAAMVHVPPPIKLIIAGEGSQRAAAERAVADHGLQRRVDFTGAISGDALIDLYAGALAVVYAPFDEDYGYVTLEAFLSAKPVITATDSGGTLEFVVNDANGFVCEPEPAAIGAAIARLAADRGRAAQLGQAGLARARQITWDGVVERLLG